MSEKPKKSKKKIVIISIVAVLLVAILGAVAIIGSKTASAIGENVFVNNVAVGNMTVKQAQEEIEKHFNDDFLNKDITVKYGDNSTTINLLGLVEIDYNKTAQNAFDKSTGLFAKLFNKEKTVVPLEFKKTDTKELDLQLKKLTTTADVSSAFKFNEDYTLVEVDASKISQLMDTQKTIDLVIENAKNGKMVDIDAVMIKSNDENFAEEMYKILSRPAQNATVETDANGGKHIVKEEPGIDADKDEFLKQYKANKGKFKMKIKPLKPEITYEDLDIPFYQDVLGSYTSYYNTGLVGRSQNVALAARFVNGIEIMPGKRFSYNSVVGERTYARGFKDATVFTGDGTEEGVGGGICQVSSTIYCAQLRADIKTIARKNHSYTITYVPLGQDATVVYGSIDYVFENNTDYPIKISAYAGGGALTVKILGTKPDKSESVDIVTVTESTTPKKEVTKETTDLPSGKTEVKQKGQNGAVVSTYKVYYKNGAEQKREFIAKSVYIPMNKITLVGVGEENADEASTTVEETPTLAEAKPTNEETKPQPTQESTQTETTNKNLSDSGL